MRLRRWVIALSLGWAIGRCGSAWGAETMRYRSAHVVLVAVGGLTAGTFDSAPDMARLREAAAKVGAQAKLETVPADAAALEALLPAARRGEQPLMVVSQTWPAGAPDLRSSALTARSNLEAAHTFSEAFFDRRPQAALLALWGGSDRELADVDLLIAYLWLRLQSKGPFKGKTTLAVVVVPPRTGAAAAEQGVLVLLGPDVRRGARPQRPLRPADIGELVRAILSGAPVESEVLAALVEPPTAVPQAPKREAKPAARRAKPRPRVHHSVDLELSGYVASEATYGSGRVALNRTSNRASTTLRGTVSKSITRVEGLSLSERPSTVRRILDARGEWRQPLTEHYRYLGVSASERKRENRGKVIQRDAYHFIVAGFGRPISEGWKMDSGLGWFETRNQGEEDGWGPSLGWQLRKKLSANLSLTGSAVMIQPVRPPHRTRFQSDLTLTRPLGERLSLRLGLLLDNFTRPLRVTEDWSYQARVSLGYRYRK